MLLQMLIATKPLVMDGPKYKRNEYIMLKINPNEDNIGGNRRFFQHGVDYRTNHSRGFGVGSPQPEMLKTNLSKTRGLITKDEKITKGLIEAQEKQKKKERWERRVNYIMRFSLSSLIPNKLISLIGNMPTITVKNIRSYLRAEWSNIEQGNVALPIYEERKRICGECPHRKFSAGYNDPLGFCTKCGCGANPRAQLTVKLKLPATSCPIDKWGEAKGVNESFWGRIRYILRLRRKQNGSIQ